jgi:gliding motility associated protien GldN
MKLRILIILIFSNFLSAQTGLLNAEKPEDISKNIDLQKTDILNYFPLEENDVLWSKVVYEYIDLDEKLNFPLLFPIDDDKNIIGRKSLWRILKEYIDNEIEDSKLSPDDPNPIQIYRTDDFTQKLRNKDVLNLMSYKSYSELLQSQGIKDSLINFVNSKDIGGYNIKGVWYFDKKYAELKYRLLGIQPVGSSIKDLKTVGSGVSDRETPFFWIWYPSLRKMLHKQMVYNDKNTATSISFDQLLISRRFNSYIYKEDNVYGNRAIGDYKKPGLQSILESERIKKEILDFELDMWNR